MAGRISIAPAGAALTRCHVDRRPSVRYPASRAGLGPQSRDALRKLRAADRADRRSAGRQRAVGRSPADAGARRRRWRCWSMRWMCTTRRFSYPFARLFAGVVRRSSTRRYARSRVASSTCRRPIRSGLEEEECEGASTAGDPLLPMAIAADHGDAERWWDFLVESRNGDDARSLHGHP